ncbi:Peptidase S10, serine carboxypeptidase [Sesbania bispinosa]|nr:Peptidase S10, serine carboxypeptidase [Sesbania bispinosa]
MFSSTLRNCRSYHGLFLLFALLLSLCFDTATSRSRIEVLPGFQGPLPFELETGYVGLGETEDDLQVFYYFIKSENNPKKDPLLLWLSGGPGCSSFTGLIYQIGPIEFEIKEYPNGSLPDLILRKPSWTKVCSIIFIDLPFGTGFSIAKNVRAQRGDRKFVQHTYQFLRKWLVEHSEFLSNKLFIGGDSYSGIPLPAIVHEIVNGNEKGLQPRMNLQGYLLGNPVTGGSERNEKIPYAHGMGLISNELYACVSGVNKYQILDPYCLDLSKQREAPQRRSMTQKLELEPSFGHRLAVSQLLCDTFRYSLSDTWMNHESVRKALHVRQGTVGRWQRCYADDYDEEISSSFEFHVKLSAKGYPSLIYSGDHDLTVPHLSTQSWIKALNYSIVHDWRQWRVDGQVAGYTRTYSNKMTFATVKAAGHAASEFKPDECFVMFTRWISNVPL